MDVEPSDRTRDFAEKLTADMDERVYPAEEIDEMQLREGGDPYAHLRPRTSGSWKICP